MNIEGILRRIRKSWNCRDFYGVLRLTHHRNRKKKMQESEGKGKTKGKLMRKKESEANMAQQSSSRELL
jgi:hypothetical protein